MAFDFPNSPTPGQVFQKWTWNGFAWVLTAPDLDATYVNVSGDTMTGHLALPTSPAAANAVRKDYVDAAVGAVDLTSRVAKAGDSMTGLLTTNTDTQNIGSAGTHNTLQVFSVGGQPSITFHLSGVFACNFGMDSGGNFYMGGWSYGATTYKFWTTKDFANISSYLSNGRTAFAGDIVTPNTNFADLVANALVSGVRTRFDSGGTYFTPDGFRTRAVQGFTTGWFTYAFA